MADPEVVRLMREFKAGLLAAEQSQTDEMVRRWLGVERALEGNIAALAQEIDRARAAGEVVKEWKLYRMERYQLLLDQVQRELARYQGWAADRVADGQKARARDGLEQAVEALRARAGMHVSFDVLPRATVEALAGFTADGTPLATLIETAWPASVDGMTQALLDGAALGWGPRKTASKMREGLESGLDRVLCIARSEQMRAYRESARLEYEESGIVPGYRRLASKDDRTCLACLLDDGKYYSITVAFSDHPSGRCVPLPEVSGMPAVAWERGRDWFRGLDAGRQRKMMGTARWDAWQAGKFDLEHLVQTLSNPTWGDRPALRSIEAAVAEAAAAAALQ